MAIIWHNFYTHYWVQFVSYYYWNQSGKERERDHLHWITYHFKVEQVLSIRFRIEHNYLSLYYKLCRSQVCSDLFRRKWECSMSICKFICIRVFKKNELFGQINLFFTSPAWSSYVCFIYCITCCITYTEHPLFNIEYYYLKSDDESTGYK